MSKQNKENVYYFILDMDGVLVEYRYNDKVFMTDRELKSVGAFLNRQPVDYIIKALNEFRKYNKAEFHVLSVAYTPQIEKEKRIWLQKNVPFILKNNVHFVASAKHKANYIDELFPLLQEDHKVIWKEKLNKKDIILIDDTHETLYEVEKRGYTVWHPTTLMNIYYHELYLEPTIKTVL